MAEGEKTMKWNTMKTKPGYRFFDDCVVAMRQYSWTDEKYAVHTSYWLDTWTGGADSIKQPGGKIIAWCEMPAEDSSEWRTADELPEIGQNVVFWEHGEPLPVRNDMGEIIDWMEDPECCRVMQFCGSWGHWNEGGNKVLRWHTLPDMELKKQKIYTNDVKSILNAS